MLQVLSHEKNFDIISGFVDTARGRSDFGRRRSNIYNRFQVFFSHQVRKYGNRDLNHIFPTLLKLMLGGRALTLITPRTPIFGPVIKNLL
jgi:hypothetical protein